MRKALTDYLIAGTYTVYQPFSTTNAMVKPYVILKIAAPFEANGGRFNSFEVWPYCAKGSFLPVDAYVDGLIARLNNKTLTCADGSRFCIEYMTTGPDYYDEALAALTRFIRFRSPTL